MKPYKIKRTKDSLSLAMSNLSEKSYRRNLVNRKKNGVGVIRPQF